MAKPTKCKFCGAAHWRYEDHIFAHAKKPLTPVGEVEAPLTAADAKRYAELKATVREHWTIVAAALTEIRDRRLFRSEYHSFEGFCQAELGHGRRYADHLITSGAIRTQVLTFGIAEPAREKTARTLAPLKDDPPKLVEAWHETVEKHGADATPAETAPQVLERLPTRHIDIAPPPPPACLHEHLVCRDCGAPSDR